MTADERHHDRDADNVDDAAPPVEDGAARTPRPYDSADIPADAPRAIHLDDHGEPDMSDEPHDELGTMAEAVVHPEHEELRRGNQWVRWGGYVVGLGLLVACVVIAIRGTDWDQVARAEAWQMWALVGLALGSLLFNAVLFLVATRPFEHEGRERIGMAEWFMIMGVSSLLNYLPKFGLIGRAVYLKRRHGVAYRASVLSMLILAAGTAVVYVVLIVATLWRGELDGVWTAAVSGVLVIGIAVAVPAVKYVLTRFSVGEVKRGMTVGVALWTLARLADSFCFAGRFYLAAEIIGSEVTFGHALVLAMASNFIEMIGPLGFREAIGGYLSSLTGMTVQQGIAVLVFDRFALTVVVVIIGLIGMPYLHWNLKGAPPIEEPAAG